MHILFVATNLPVPANNGQSIRNLSLLRALKSMGHDVSFVCFASFGSSDRVRILSEYCYSIDVLEGQMPTLTKGSDYLRRLATLFALRSFSVERFKSEAMRMLVRRKLLNHTYDLLICDGVYAFTNVPETDVPVVLNCHNVEHVILSRYAKIERNPFKRYYALIESSFMRAAERHSLEGATSAMVCSNVDLKLLQDLRSGLLAFVVPNVVDIERISPRDLSLGSSNSMLFQGGMDWYPNRDAVECFVHNILSRVRSQCPGARLVVAGRNPPAEFLDRFRADPLIEFTGTVPDMLPYLSAARVVVVPLRMGGGTRIKILEACAAGKPVVSTRIGAEGLNLEPEREIILADDPDQFANSVIEILQNPMRAESLGKAARAAVVDRYGMSALQDSLHALLASSQQRQHASGQDPTQYASC